MSTANWKFVAHCIRGSVEMALFANCEGETTAVPRQFVDACRAGGRLAVELDSDGTRILVKRPARGTFSLPLELLQQLMHHPDCGTETSS